MNRTVLTAVAVALAALTLTGCFSRSERACHQPQAYAAAEDLPPLRIPPGLETPDTRNALRVPELNEPEPPRRRGTDPCLDTPPSFTTAKDTNPTAAN
jgi:uncharacterized lipoprotein